MKTLLEKIGTIFIVLLFVVLAGRDLMNSYMLFGHSAYIDMVRQVVVEHGLRTRLAFPWWVPEFYFGCGSPIFLFYAPLPYMISGAISLLGAGPVLGIKLTYLIALAMAGITMYRLSGALFGRWGGVLSAALYIAAPYMLLDLYVRSSIGEVVSLALVPEIFYQLLQISRTGRWRHVATGSLLFAGLILAHNIAALIFAPCLVAWAALLLVTRPDKRRGILLVALFGFGLGLSFFFWYPALAEKGFVQSEQSLTAGFFHYANHFVYPSQVLSDFWGYGSTKPGPDDGMALGPGRIHLLLLAISVLLVLFRKGMPRRDVLFFAFLVSTGIFFMLKPSGFLWETLPLIRFLQFPWRFLMLVTFAAAAGAGAVVHIAGERRPQLVKYICLVCLVAVAVYAAPRAKAKYLLHDLNTHEPALVDLATVADEAAWGENRIPANWFLGMETILRLGVTSTAKDDYLPVWAVSPPKREVETFLETVSGEVTLAEKLERGDRFHYSGTASQDSTLLLHVFYYPGWEAMVNSKIQEVKPQKGTGLMLVSVPKGPFSLAFHFAGSGPRIAAKDLSVAVLFVWLLGVLWATMSWRRKRAGLKEMER